MWQWPLCPGRSKKKDELPGEPRHSHVGRRVITILLGDRQQCLMQDTSPFFASPFLWGKKKCWEPCPLIQVHAVKMWLAGTADNSCYSFLGTAACHTAVLIFCTTLFCVHPQRVSFENFRWRDLSKTRAPQHLTLTEQNLSLLYFPLICLVHLTQEV